MPSRSPTAKPFTEGPSSSPTARPTTGSPSVSPSSSPTARASPSERPSVSPTDTPSSSPTKIPTLAPSQQPTPSPTTALTTNAELRTAIQEYLSQGCTNDVNCQARSKYGGAIGNWDVSRVTKFNSLFVDAPGAETFNEVINWNTDSATSMRDMFAYAWAFNQPLSFRYCKGYR
ncbi:hypothetical protein THAOC_01677, partial [Thalassiosira oceanica]